ncbi:E1b 19k protein [Cynomolgus adenovirus 1]|uniref:E1B protein, small T-antigen n=1 Tax=Cynomolgus adenovirus 1 TaxID=507488 RepID=A0A1C8EG46_9ADEN|nr:E1b 19k protein [Cynomolgus adenovirus 1]ALM55111.1 E1b 19k protein [Cynomolgus adenovirus 1]
MINDVNFVCLFKGDYLGGIKGAVVRLGHFTMDLRVELQTFESTRCLLELCSNRASWWKRLLFGTSLCRLVRQVKEEYQSEFEHILSTCQGLFESLELGHHTVFQEKIVKALDFSSPGRAVAAIAFAAFILDRWNTQTQLSPGYTLDYISLQLWRFWLRRRVYNYSRGLPPLGRASSPEEQLPEVKPEVAGQGEEQEQKPALRSGLGPPEEN